MKSYKYLFIVLNLYQLGLYSQKYSRNYESLYISDILKSTEYQIEMKWNIDICKNLLFQIVLLVKLS